MNYKDQQKEFERRYESVMTSLGSCPTIRDFTSDLFASWKELVKELEWADTERRLLKEHLDLRKSIDN